MFYFPRMTKRRERSLNTETFGMIPRNYRGRPYRSRGGRGGRGGRGRGAGPSQHNRRVQATNRAWVDYEFDFEAAGLRNRAAGNKQGGIYILIVFKFISAGLESKDFHRLCQPYGQKTAKSLSALKIG